MSTQDDIELDVVVPSDKVNDYEYIQRLLVDTKLRFLKALADSTANDFQALVKRHDISLSKYPDLVETYGLQSVASTAKRPKFKRKIKKTATSAGSAQGNSAETKPADDDVTTTPVTPVSPGETKPADDDVTTTPVTPVSPGETKPADDDVTTTPVTPVSPTTVEIEDVNTVAPPSPPPPPKETKASDDSNGGSSVPQVSPKVVKPNDLVEGDVNSSPVEKKVKKKRRIKKKAVE